MPGFLANRKAFLDARMTGVTNNRPFISHVWHAYGDAAFDARSLYEGFKTALEGWPYKHMDLDPLREPEAVRQLGAYISDQLEGSTFPILPKIEIMRRELEVSTRGHRTLPKLVTLATAGTYSPRRWKLVPLDE